MRIPRREFLRISAAAVAAPLVLTSRKAAAEQRPRPNILLVFPDQHRFDWTAFNPEVPVRTPHLTALAKRGVRFTRAYCPSPVCAPSRCCLAQGRQYDGAAIKSNDMSLPEGSVTFYTLLREAGYRVGSLGKLDLRKPEKDWGRDGRHRVGEREFFLEWGFTDGLDSEGKGDSLAGAKKGLDAGPYINMLGSRTDNALATYLNWWEAMRAHNQNIPSYSYTEPMELADAAYNDNWVGQNALDLLNDFPKNHPWFLQVNFPGPHVPLDITPPMQDWYRNVDFPAPHANTQLPGATHTAIRQNYAAMIENIDNWLGAYVEAIAARGEEENTLVVFSSDHGEMLGDHGEWGKRLPYEPSASVPLVIAGTDIRGGRVHDKPCQTLDLTATFLDYAGLDAPSDMDSRSLRPLLKGRLFSGRDYALSGLQEWRMVVTERYKLIRGGYTPGEVRTTEGPESWLLFDLKHDPQETRNLSAKKPRLVRRLASRLPQPRPIKTV